MGLRPQSPRFTTAINIEDTDGMSRHRLMPYNATISTDIHSYEVSGSISIDTYFLKQLVPS